MDRIVRSERVVYRGDVRPGAVHVRGGKIADVTEPSDVPVGAEVDDVGDLVVMPGLVDSHVHVNEPGRTHWEGFETATKAAAAGGVTTIVDMPLNSVPSTTDVEALEEKVEAARGKCHVDVGFWGGVVPGNAGELESLHDAGVLGFKCFRIDSGVEEFEHVGVDDLREAMPVLADLETVLLTHAELPGPVEDAAGVWDGKDPRSHATYLASRPRAAEDEAIAEMIELADEFDCRVHIVHLSSSDALDDLRKAHAAGVPVTVETCPHYLAFTSDHIGDGATAFKCAPPIREPENRERLWSALLDGDLDLVATDHSPSPPEAKFPEGRGFNDAWGGIASLQVSLPTVWTEARDRGASLVDLAEWLCSGPARLAGIDDRKGTLEPGTDADLVVWNPDASFEIDADRLHHRHPITPYDGVTLNGRVRTTYLRGIPVYDDGVFPDPRSGEFLLHRNLPPSPGE